MSKLSGITTVPLSEVPKQEMVESSNPYRPLILVVDDECAIADSLAEILRRSGYRTKAAYDGNAALDMALLSPPDMMITDVMLPGMNGIELGITMRRIYPDCKVLLFSGSASTTSMMEAATRTGHNFVLLTKPVHPTEMLACVSDFMRPRRQAMAAQSA
jgi:DNA-binding response OmpR family regulator